jgi:acetoacetyl-CoA synthetase
VQALLFGARMIMYDGSPFLPDLTTFIHLYSQLKVTHLGISPRYLQEMQKIGIAPRKVADLSDLQVVTSTGMVLSDQMFEWFYDEGFPPHVQLDNISGGTDIAGAFALGNPLLPVYVGGCQSPSLGTPIAVFDQTLEGGRGIKGQPVEDGVPGELVATRAFPNMPRFFWGDERGQRYFDSYFAKFDDCWVHGDFVQIHPVTKQIIFLGRSDGVLNPSGVRFGSGEIYGVVDSRFGREIADSICVGQVRLACDLKLHTSMSWLTIFQRRPTDSDERVMLFVLMKPGKKFSQGLVNEIKVAIRKELSPRHVPKYVFETPEIPVSMTSIAKSHNSSLTFPDDR